MTTGKTIALKDGLREYHTVRTHTKEITWIQDQHRLTTSSTLCRMPHLNNKQNKNKNPIFIRQDYHLAQPWPSEEKQTKNSAQISTYTKLTQTTGPTFSSFSSVSQSCPTLCDPMDCSMTGLPVHHQLPEFTQTHVHWVSDAIEPSHRLSSPSPTFNLSQHQGLSKSVLCIRRPKYWSFSFSISPSNEHPGLISFRMDWLDLLAAQGTLKSLL